MTNIRVLATTAVFLLMGCVHKEDKPVACSDWLGPRQFKCQLQNPGNSYSIFKTKMEGREAVRFEIRKGERFTTSDHQSFRTEIKTNYFPEMGSVKWYRFSIFLPQKFPIEDNRLVLSQWWAKTKKHLGEVDRSPILQLRFSQGTLAVLLRRYPDRIVKDSEKYFQTRLFEINPLPLGTWHDFVFQVKWSSKDDGFIEAWWNSKKVISFKGKTENQDEVGPAFKFGLYRNDSPKTYISYVGEVLIGDTLESVGSPSLAQGNTAGGSEL